MSEYQKYQSESESVKLIDSITNFISITSDFVINKDITEWRKKELINAIDILIIVASSLRDGLLKTITGRRR